MTAPAPDRPIGVNRAIDTKTAQAGHRERRVRRLPPPRHPRLQPPRRRRRHRRPRRHGRPRRPTSTPPSATPSPACAPGTATAGPTSAPGSASPAKPPSNAGAPPPTSGHDHRQHPRSRGAARDPTPARRWLPHPDLTMARARGRTPHPGSPASSTPGGCMTATARSSAPATATWPPSATTPAHRNTSPPRPRPRRLRPVARSHLARRRMHPPHPPRRPDPQHRPRHRGNPHHHPHLGPARRRDLQSLRQPPHLRLPVLRRDLPPRRLPAHPRRADRRQRHPRTRLRSPGRVRHLHRPLLRPGPHPPRPAAHLRQQGPTAPANRSPATPAATPKPARTAASWPASPATAATTPGSGSRCARTATTTPPPWCGTTRHGRTVAAHQASHRTSPRPARPPPRHPLRPGPCGDGRYRLVAPFRVATAKPPNTRPAARSTSTPCSASTAWTPPTPTGSCPRPPGSPSPTWTRPPGTPPPPSAT